MSLEYSPEPPEKRQRLQPTAFLPDSSVAVARKHLLGRGKKLAQLLDLPLDVLFEILSHLRPLDLLHLARSWRAMRRFLINRNAKWIWKKALSGVKGLPECPPVMSEPQFANLMFSRHCHYCGAEPVHTIIWLTRNRVCRRCFPNHFQRVKNLHEDPRFCKLPEPCWKFAQLSGSVIHNTSFTPITSRDTCQKIVSLELLGKLSEEHAMVADQPQHLEEWLEKTRFDHEAWAGISATLTAWQSDQVHKRSLELDAVRQRRLDAVVRNLNAAGWEDDIKKMDLELLRRHELVRIPKDLTNRVWEKIKPQIVEFMERVCLKLREEYRHSQITRRRRTFARYITSFHDRYPIPAPISELSQYDPIRSIIEDTSLDQILTFDSFPPPQAIVQLLVRWFRQKREILSQIMQKSALVSGRVTSHHLNLATTFFLYHGSGLHEPIGQLEILVHPAASSWRPCQRPSTPESVLRIFNDFHQEFWNFGGDRVSFHETAFLAARSIVATCNCDPDTTSASKMDSMFRLLECVPCRSLSTGRLVMPWRRAVVHSIDHSNFSISQAPQPRWNLLDPADPFYRFAMGQITGEVPSFRCHICHIDGNASFITSHIKERHTLTQTVTVMRQPHLPVRVPYY